MYNYNVIRIRKGWFRIKSKHLMRFEHESDAKQYQTICESLDSKSVYIVRKKFIKY